MVSSPLQPPLSPTPTCGGGSTTQSISSNSSSSNSSSSSSSSCTSIYYFGYGPIVNPIVRKRRGVKVCGIERPAILPEHKLTWQYGGVVNMIQQRGYEVMGILLKFCNEEDWAQFQQFDAGYGLDEVTVYPISPASSPSSSSSAAIPAVDGENGGDDNEDDDDSEEDRNNDFGEKDLTIDPANGIKAYTFVMKDFDETKLLSSKIEKLPGERYLKLIASGMRQYGIDEDYIEDQIMSVPYVPQRKPDEYRTFPSSIDRSSTSSSTSTPSSSSFSTRRKSKALPKISLARYRTKLCSHKHRQTSPDDVFFVMQGRVIKVDRPYDITNPSVIWLRDRVMGLSGADCTLIVHQTVVDPDIPMVDKSDDITPLHQAWAENHIVEWMEQGGLTGTAIFELLDDNMKKKNNNSSSKNNNKNKNPTTTSGSTGSGGDGNTSGIRQVCSRICRRSTWSGLLQSRGNNDGNRNNVRRLSGSHHSHNSNGSAVVSGRDGDHIQSEASSGIRRYRRRKSGNEPDNVAGSTISGGGFDNAINSENRNGRYSVNDVNPGYVDDEHYDDQSPSSLELIRVVHGDPNHDDTDDDSSSTGR